MRELMIGDMFVSAYNQNPKFPLDYPQHFMQKLLEVLPVFLQPDVTMSSLPSWQDRDYSVPEGFRADDVVAVILEALKNVITSYKGTAILLERQLIVCRTGGSYS